MNSIKFIILLFCPFAAWAATKPRETNYLERPRNTTVTIYFHGTLPQKKIEMFVWDVRNLMDYQKVYEEKVTGNISRFKLNLRHPVNIGFEADEVSLYSSRAAFSIAHGFVIEPGDNLRLDVGTNVNLGIMNVKFSGKGSGKYNCIQQLIKTVNAQIRKPVFKLSVEELFLRADSDQMLVDKIVARYRSVMSRQAFSIVRLQYLNNAFLTALTRLSDEKNNTDTSGKYRQIVNQLFKKFATDAACYDQGNLVLLQKLAFLKKKLVESDPYDPAFYREHPTLYYELLSSAYNDYREVQEVLLGNYLTALLAANGITEEMSKCMDRLILMSNKSNAIYPQLRSLRQIYKSRFTEGGYAYDFALPDTNGRIVHQRDLIGKIVIIDFFFTGCVGCYTTVPVLDSLERVYDGKEVAFVSVGVDKTIVNWKKGIGSFSSKYAIQLFTKGLAFEHPMIKFYRVNSYPTIVLVGKDGKLISAHAPDPRDSIGLTAFTKLIDDGIRRNTDGGDN